MWDYQYSANYSYIQSECVHNAISPTKYCDGYEQCYETATQETTLLKRSHE